MSEPGLASADDFRWQAFFQRTTDPLFLLNRQRRLLFVNHAWETLAGLSAAQARGLLCRKQQPASLDDSLEDVLAHALCPPPEVLRGARATATARRLLPTSPLRAACWWDVEFLPLRDHDKLRGILGRIRPLPLETLPATVPLPEKLVALRQRVAERYNFAWLRSATPAVQRLEAQVRLAATLAAPVSLVGEAGSGKESTARVIHYQSAVREKAFVALDCAHLPADALAEVLLTNQAALQRRHAGTVYLHESQRLPRDLQQALLGLLHAANAPRLLAGFEQDPQEDMRSGRLLPELWSALAVFVLQVPPLRERLADLPLFVERLLARAAPLHETAITGVTPAAFEVLRQHLWPGNVRELYTVLASACRTAKGRIDVSDLPAALRLTHRLSEPGSSVPERPLPLDALLEQAERRLLKLALQRSRGNKSRAAELLDITRQRLLRRLEALGLLESEPLAELELEEDE